MVQFIDLTLLMNTTNSCQNFPLFSFQHCISRPMNDEVEEVCILLIASIKCSYVNDGAYFCYCAYVLRISRYSGFLWVPIDTGIFLRGL